MKQILVITRTFREAVEDMRTLQGWILKYTVFKTVRTTQRTDHNRTRGSDIRIGADRRKTSRKTPGRDLQKNISWQQHTKIF